jgi:selenocysteine lyase/cysteine desulfurase
VHANGKPVIQLFGPEDREGTGGTIIMNFFNSKGESYFFEAIEAKANLQKISIRSGCFCNPGIDEINSCVTTEELVKYFSSRDAGGHYDMLEFLNKMRGAIRVSVGIATSKKDVDTFISFVRGLCEEG